MGGGLPLIFHTQYLSLSYRDRGRKRYRNNCSAIVACSGRYEHGLILPAMGGSVYDIRYPVKNNRWILGDQL